MQFRIILSLAKLIKYTYCWRKKVKCSLLPQWQSFCQRTLEESLSILTLAAQTCMIQQWQAPMGSPFYCWLWFGNPTQRCDNNYSLTHLQSSWAYFYIVKWDSILPANSTSTSLLQSSWKHHLFNKIFRTLCCWNLLFSGWEYICLHIQIEESWSEFFLPASCVKYFIFTMHIFPPEHLCPSMGFFCLKRCTDMHNKM